jgi:hypothetical protein
MRDDVGYWRRRAQEERERAMAAMSGTARAAHLELAAAYEARLSSPPTTNAVA